MADQNHQRRLFLGCFIGLVATAFGFAVRGAVLNDWGVQYGLTEEQKGIISGVGMIAVGTIGVPAIGTVQDADFNRVVQEQMADVHQAVAHTKTGLFSDYEYVDRSKYESLTDQQRTQLAGLESGTKQQALAKIAVLPVIMCVCYVGLILYFKSRGGYQAQVLTGHAARDEKFTGGTAGPGEA